jgi:hypothetical protein
MLSSLHPSNTEAALIRIIDFFKKLREKYAQAILDYKGDDESRREKDKLLLATIDEEIAYYTEVKKCLLLTTAPTQRVTSTIA